MFELILFIITTPIYVVGVMLCVVLLGAIVIQIISIPFYIIEKLHHPKGP